MSEVQDMADAIREADGASLATRGLGQAAGACWQQQLEDMARDYRNAIAPLTLEQIMAAFTAEVGSPVWRQMPGRTFQLSKDGLDPVVDPRRNGGGGGRDGVEVADGIHEQQRLVLYRERRLGQGEDSSAHGDNLDRHGFERPVLIVETPVQSGDRLTLALESGKPSVIIHVFVVPDAGEVRP